jgi:hypothetical protein
LLTYLKFIFFLNTKKKINFSPFEDFLYKATNHNFPFFYDVKDEAFFFSFKKLYDGVKKGLDLEDEILYAMESINISLYDFFDNQKGYNRLSTKVKKKKAWFEFFY